MAYGALDPWDEQQDEFSSSFFQQPQPYSAPEPEPTPQMPSASEPPRDFTSSVFGGGAGSVAGVFAPEKAAEFARRHAPADYGGVSAGSSSQPPSAPSSVRGPVGPTSAGAGVSGGGSFDYGSLVDKVKTSADPRARAVAQDQLARATYSQLKNAGHEVSWEGDNLVVDGRPYVIGDGASAQPAAAAAAPTSAKTAPTGGPGMDYYANATGRTQGGAGSPQEAYNNLSSRIDPNASPEEMQAAIEEEFGHLPGYGGAYKESVMLNGRWYDMVVGYGGAGASWGGLTPKGPSSHGMTSSVFGSGGVMSGALSPFGGSGGSGLGNRGVEGARGVALSTGLSPSILALLQQQQQAPEPEPMQPSYMNLLR
jgi:hypothetical protein